MILVSCFVPLESKVGQHYESSGVCTCLHILFDKHFVSTCLPLPNTGMKERSSILTLES